ncbi:MAG: ThuA domain-containing protein [Rhodothermales bacterium]|nr:ThuA domain-containing protein [Rhodothermales bacterium]MDG2015650.1 ThuA domain-containing protein [Rhodothermales bacterium]
MNRKLIAAFFVLISLVVVLFLMGPSDRHILVFSQTQGFRHGSISDGHSAISKLAASHSIEVDSTESSDVFTDEGLAKYDAVMFLNTTGDVLNEQQQIAFQRYIQGGGGYIGVHSASDTEYGWPWYGQLVGAYFVDHPAIQEARLVVDDSRHPSTAHLDDEWVRSDEWYNHRFVNDNLNVLLSIDKQSYDAGTDTFEGATQPMSWYHTFDGGRSFYTNMGHRPETWLETDFLNHLLGGIEWATEGGPTAELTPNESEFTQVVLKENLREPMEVAPLPDGRALFIERHGSMHMVDPANGVDGIIAEIDVFSEMEDGLLGLALDPGFESNGWLYLYYSSPNVSQQQLSRFHFNGNTLDMDSEVVLLTVPTQRFECCHAGGAVEFGPDGFLYLSTGDDTNPFASDGYSPSDEQPDRAYWDAQRTAANTRDLRGKILRIRPENDGTYSIPKGNLFADGANGHPEIYVMGNRNPFRISIDQETNWLYWGEVGPDATADSTDRGPAGHDELNQAREAGFYGWPYFVGDNKAYHEWDFSTEQSLGVHDASQPINNSPNNTGAKQLPPAQSAWIWYPYGASSAFPLLETGGRTAMAGPVFRSESKTGFPPYFEGKLFVYEWMRHKIFLVTMDENGEFDYMERFLPSTTLSRPMDMAFADDGSLFLLEYGNAWNSRNVDARISYITFNP